jgi:hypothetical protein
MAIRISESTLVLLNDPKVFGAEKCPWTLGYYNRENP